MKLDIGCGANKKEGFTGIDIAAIEGVDIVHDLNVYPWPIEDNSIDEVWCSHYIEHIVKDNPIKLLQDLIVDCETFEEFKSKLINLSPEIPSIGVMKFMNEVCRILKSGGQATFISPYYTSVRAMQDPTHVNFISEQFYLYYNKGWREANKLDHYPITCDFNITQWAHSWNANWVSRSQEAKNFALQHYNNVVDDLWAILIKI
jgi:hypothetical protein